MGYIYYIGIDIMAKTTIINNCYALIGFKHETK